MTSLHARMARFRGVHLAAIMVGFFAVVVAVNIAMATLASRTFSGAIVRNGYVANQDFDTLSAAGRRQAALGWAVSAKAAGNRIMVELRDRDGAPLDGANVTGTIRHPIAAGRPSSVMLRPVAPGIYAAVAGVPRGQWDVLIRIKARGRDYRLNERLYLGG